MQRYMSITCLGEPQRTSNTEMSGVHEKSLWQIPGHQKTPMGRRLPTGNCSALYKEL